ncbi:ABC transporter substrate-binding protein [Marinobacter sp. TBZ242]|uniref:ABC transporter substrate-binding protein n=1 Tax=Marinobacter azerbaijanicus TaxID=3050455 RepID=A0ABT7IGC9_9GAMM|nr:ABC transporter substrate-binding protein [Marinobacter sp. TBZ242]MDL0433231.1 ABC transporter substrate-binding protein [Marinobacter sp. TBZ242]
MNLKNVLVTAVLSSAMTFTQLHAAEKVDIGLSVPNFGPYAAVYVADELGYYADEGLEVQITAFRGGSAAQQALASDAMDIINYFPPGAAVAIERGVEQKVVAVGAARPDGWHMMVKAGSSIEKPEDLDGRRVGITGKNSTTDYYALWVADQYGIEIETVPVGGAGMIPALLSDQVDAISAFSPLTYRLMVSGDGRSLVDYAKDMPPTLPDVWVASQDMIDDRPEQVEGVLRAMYRATRYMQENRDYSIDFLREFTGEDDPEVLRLEYEVGIMNRATRANIEPEWLKASLGLAGDSGSGALSPDEVYTDQFADIGAE